MHRLLPGTRSPYIAALQACSMRGQYDLYQPEDDAEGEHLEFKCHCCPVIDLRRNSSASARLIVPLLGVFTILSLVPGFWVTTEPRETESQKSPGFHARPHRGCVRAWPKGRRG